MKRNYIISILITVSILAFRPFSVGAIDLFGPNDTYFKGTNTYVDPTKDPKYYQNYTEIQLNDVNLEFLDTFNTNFGIGYETDSIKPEVTVKFSEPDKSISVKTGKNLKDFKESIEKEKKAKKLTLKSTQFPQITSLTFNISPQDKRLEKLKNELLKPDTLKDQIRLFQTIPNKELMDILYPSKEKIDKQNNDIEKERREIYNYNQSQKSPKEKVVSFIQNLVNPSALAGNLNNNINNSVVYMRANNSLALDLIGNGVSYGNEFQLYPQNNTAAQNFKMIDRNDANGGNNNGGEIKYGDFGRTGQPGFCLDRAGGGMGNGTKIQLWGCNGSRAQLWKAYDDGTIRPVDNSGYCLDASSGVGTGSKIHLWSCHGGSNQRFQISNYDFSGYRYYMTIHASNLRWYDANINGHALVSVKRSDGYGKNTFSFWPDRDWDNGNHDSRTNNMSNLRTDNQWSNVQVDHTFDFGIMIGTYGFRQQQIEITKQIFDEIKFMNGYQLEYVNQNYDVCSNNCAKYSVDLWNKYNGSNRDYDSYGGCYFPGKIYNALPEY